MIHDYSTSQSVNDYSLSNYQTIFMQTIFSLHRGEKILKWLNFLPEKSGADEVTEEEREEEKDYSDLIWLASDRSTPGLKPHNRTV